MTQPFRTFYEDLPVDVTVAVGECVVEREEVIAFAARYDPQDFHLDDEAAARGPFGALAASGWHTCGMMMRLMVDEMHAQGLASLGGAGIDELRWLHPVYPGDRLRLEAKILNKRRSRSRPEMGLMRRELTMINQNGKPVLRCVVNGMVGVRDPSAPIED